MKLKGKTLEGEDIEFEIEQIGNVFKSDGVLYLDDVVQVAISLDSIRSVEAERIVNEAKKVIGDIIGEWDSPHPFSQGIYDLVDGLNEFIPSAREFLEKYKKVS